MGVVKIHDNNICIANTAVACVLCLPKNKNITAKS